MPRWFRGVLGTLAGYALSLASSLALFLLSGHPPQLPQPAWFIALTAVYGIVFSILAGYTAARIGGYNAGFAVGVILFVLAILTALEAPKAPHWAEIVTLVAMCPATVIGARLGRRGGF